MRARSAGAPRYIVAPVTAPVTRIRIVAHVKTLFASARSPRPSATEMGTADPTPMRSASAKFTITNGIARLMAANAVAPTNWPTNTPSSVCHSDEASMLTAPGTAAMRKRRRVGVSRYSARESIVIPSSPHRRTKGRPAVSRQPGAPDTFLRSRAGAPCALRRTTLR